MGSLYLLQGNFPTQESNWGLLNCRLRAHPTHVCLCVQTPHPGEPREAVCACTPPTHVCLCVQTPRRDAACWAESLELQIPEWFLRTHTLPSTCLFSTRRLPFLKSTPCHMFCFPSCLSFSTCRFCIFCIRIMQRAVYNADASGPHSRSRDSGWGREGVMAANPPALPGPQGIPLCATV